MSELMPQAVAAVVDRFYDQVRIDPELGPIFGAAIDDWPEHKRLVTSFWCSVALGMRSYRGNPVTAHRPHPIRAEHFARWLALWKDVVEAVLPPEHASPMIDYATRIGESMRYRLGLDE
jgi:hemoglobin